MPSLKAGTGKLKIEGQEVRLRVHTNLPADHSFYAMVGRVASEWSNLEHTLDLIIWDLVSFRANGLGANVVACITSQIMGVAPDARRSPYWPHTITYPRKPYLNQLANL